MIEYTTLQQFFKTVPKLADLVVAGRKAKDIYKYMRFIGVDGRTYEVWDVYLIDDFISVGNALKLIKQLAVKINIKGDFLPVEAVREWIPGSIGEGMKVACPDGNKGTVFMVVGGRLMCVLFEDSNKSIYAETDLIEVI